MKAFLFIFLIMCVYSINAKAENLPVTADSFIDLAYGNMPAQRMDIYLPANRSLLKTPSLILLHGGGWNREAGIVYPFMLIVLKHACPVMQYLILITGSFQQASVSIHRNMM